MKILIVTPYGESNYGNKFQNYALQTYLESFGHEVVTITNESWYLSIKKDKPSLWLKTKIKIWNMLYGREKIARKNKFKRFSNKYIKKSKFSNKMKYDLVCIGSDQIWNPQFSDNFYYTYGGFADNVVSYAASFGIDEIPNEYANDVKKYLKRIKHISVREEAGSEIVKKLIGQKPEVHVDPTMLLTTDDWDKILKKPKKCPTGKYIFTYFLGTPSKETLEKIQSISKSKGFEIVDVGQKSTEKYFNTDPSEFLYLLKNSEMIFTDSFHGSVFSILYKKNFYVTKRIDNLKSMSSRIDTLFNKFKIENKKLEECSFEEGLGVDFSYVEEVLNEERKKSKKYLQKAVDVEGE